MPTARVTIDSDDRAFDHTAFDTCRRPFARDESTLVNEQARLTVKYERGAISILRVERMPLASPQRMRRWRGRFEARAVAAGKTLDFVRFDFPLMAEAEAPGRRNRGREKTRAEAARARHGDDASCARRCRPAPPSVAIYDTVTKKSATADLPPAAAGAGSTKR